MRRLNNLNYKLLYILSLSLASFSVNAKLAYDTFGLMVIRSQLIVEAKPVHFEGNRTTFKILKYFKGKSSSNLVTIVRSTEEHDQKIYFVGKHILFLMRGPKGKWMPSSYGRSYWPLLNVVDLTGRQNKKCYYAVPDVYPFSMVRSGKYLNSKLMKVYYQYLTSDQGFAKAKVYCYRDIQKAIKLVIDKQTNKSASKNAH
ncbi:hypothetical protein MNBD_GAMMA12-3255 [hydrothermal vent metagenome]|uniref:Uncharacterized protein n=1 Tax=hydrothermal vent metagenome TaxID=652676 RepID=A0A3B0Z0T6_9ZZZZ